MFNLLNSILERLADSVKPFLGLILQILPSLWEESSGMTLLRIQVVFTQQSLPPRLLATMAKVVTHLPLSESLCGNLPVVKHLAGLRLQTKGRVLSHAIVSQILMSIQRIVNSLGRDSPSAYPLVIPILQQCTDQTQVDTYMADSLSPLSECYQQVSVCLRHPLHDLPN